MEPKFIFHCTLLWGVHCRGNSNLKESQWKKLRFYFSPMRISVQEYNPLILEWCPHSVEQVKGKSLDISDASDVSCVEFKLFIVDVHEHVKGEAAILGTLSRRKKKNQRQYFLSLHNLLEGIVLSTILHKKLNAEMMATLLSHELLLYNSAQPFKTHIMLKK